MRISNRSSDVCSSDLGILRQHREIARRPDQSRKQEERGQQMGREAEMADVGALREPRCDHPPADRPLQSDKRRQRDRTSVVKGKSVSVHVDFGGRRIIKKTKVYTSQHMLALLY